MAEMMLAARIPVSVWARRLEVSSKFEQLGAVIKETPADLATSVDHLGICVTADADLRELIWGKEVLDAMRAGSVLSIHSTVRPGLCEEIAISAARRGIDVLDAPVSGSGIAARAGRLLMFIGGDKSVLERVQSAFQAYANPIVHQGAVGAGMRAKLLNNILSAAHMGLAAWALNTAPRLGVHPAELREAVLAGTGKSAAMDAIVRLSEPARAAHIGALVAKDVLLACDELSTYIEPEIVSLAQSAIAAFSRWSAGEDRPIPPA